MTWKLRYIPIQFQTLILNITINIVSTASKQGNGSVALKRTITQESNTERKIQIYCSMRYWHKKGRWMCRDLLCFRICGSYLSLAQNRKMDGRNQTASSQKAMWTFECLALCFYFIYYKKNLRLPTKSIYRLCLLWLIYALLSFSLCACLGFSEEQNFISETWFCISTVSLELSLQLSRTLRFRSCLSSQNCGVSKCALPHLENVMLGIQSKVSWKSGMHTTKGRTALEPGRYLFLCLKHLPFFSNIIHAYIHTYTWLWHLYHFLKSSTYSLFLPKFYQYLMFLWLWKKFGSLVWYKFSSSSCLLSS